MIINKKILIFGGTGSLGYKLNERYSSNNEIINFSRDENKHWKMKADFNYNTNIKFIIGNISDKERVKTAIIRTNPNIVIIAAAMKHIDQCEYNTHESINTNLLGTKNILDSINEELNKLDELSTVIFVSSDKACSPINNYGMCKALCETLMVEKSYYINNVKFVTVRYGNVLNSRGSIIPLLHSIGIDDSKKKFTITHKDMTRFVMTLEQSVDLIEYSILNGETGDIIIPELISMRVIDLIEIFSEKYNKSIIETGIRPGEKMQESLINITQSTRIIKKDNYIHIKSVFSNIFDNSNIRDYNSDINIIDKKTLKEYLIELNLI
jgi:FlaA1/EpsC-like NDP-sugar epimerase